MRLNARTEIRHSEQFAKTKRIFFPFLLSNVVKFKNVDSISISCHSEGVRERERESKTFNFSGVGSTDSQKGHKYCDGFETLSITFCVARTLTRFVWLPHQNNAYEKTTNEIAFSWCKREKITKLYDRIKIQNEDSL